MSEEPAGLVGQVASSALGFDDLSSGQEEAAAAVLAGRDVLVVMPTGSGKSAIYQIVGTLREGASVVVSPLIALQHDQVSSIGGQLGGAAQLNSSLTDGQRRETLADLDAGDVEFVFVAPEQLANEETLERIRRARPSLFVVDEAHCISSWGHDFRPDYLRLGAVVEALGHPPVLALTATAAPPVRQEIVDQLRMRDPVVVVRGFFRANIHLAVETHPHAERAREALVERGASSPGAGIVYVAERAQAEELASALAARGRDAFAYHAGLPARRRQEVHERFSAGDDVVVVATIAFGMGIDAPHVRFVLHADPPESLDAHYQELGRAGRDGEPAASVVFRSLDDAGGRRFFAGAGTLEPALLDRLASAAAATSDAVPAATLARLLDVSEARLAVALDRLAQVGAVEVDGAGGARWTGGERRPAEVAALAGERHERYRATERSRAEMMRRFLDTGECRWRVLLAYLGQPGDARCGNCDNCDNCDQGDGDERGDAREQAGDAGESREPGDDRLFPLGARVTHHRWGAGQVIGYEGDTMTVLFDEAGYRTLGVDLVVQGDLLQPR